MLAQVIIYAHAKTIMTYAASLIQYNIKMRKTVIYFVIFVLIG